MLQFFKDCPGRFCADGSDPVGRVLPYRLFQYPTRFPMKCVINRRAEFSASHRYYLPELSLAENEQRFGLGALPKGHGHNYELFVRMYGDIDDQGMVLNLSDVKHVIKKEVTAQLDGQMINDTWPEFEATMPTTENIAMQIWKRLEKHLPIISITLYEHPKLFAEYLGNDMEAFLTVGTHFSAAHRLALDSLSLEENTEIYGKCARVNGHGHNYHLDITVKGEIDPRTGMIVELMALHKIIDEIVVEPLDHTFLNKDIPFFAGTVPTAENIALYVARLLDAPIRELGASLHKVNLIESPNNSCEILWSQDKDRLLTPAVPVLATV
jgi:6-pyruvoyltetrahydropterin/6-carboxytetrahydropterin synthase